MHLNLLPVGLLRRELIRTRLLQWSVVWAAALVVMVVMAWLQHAGARRFGAELASLQARHARVKATQTELQVTQRELQELQQREALVLGLSQRRPMLTLLGMLSEAAQQSEGNVALQEIIWKADVAEDDMLSQTPTLSLRGIGVDNVWIAQFASRLRQHDILRDVQITSTEQAKLAESTMHHFQLQCVCQ